MHSSAVDVINEALVVLGQDTVLSAAEVSKESSIPAGRKAAYLYEGARHRVLRDHVWNFARAEETVCSGSCGDCDCGGDFPYRIPPPPRCERIIMCYGNGGRQCEYIVQSGLICSRSEVRRVAYVADMEDVTRWSVDARRALVLRLAADLAKPVTGRINERQLQEQAYAEAIANAKRNDANECNIPYDAWGMNYYVEAMGRRCDDFWGERRHDV